MARILIAEDEEALRTFLIRTLESCGHEVKVLADGVQALQTLQKNSFDMLLSDIVMPELDGIALALKVTGTGPTCRSFSSPVTPKSASGRTI